MEARLDYAKLAPEAMRALLSLGAYLAKCGLEHPLLELVKIRASQINGCAYCIDMHTKDARALGETEQRIYSLGAWRETSCFSPAERAALALTEAVTVLHEQHVPAAVVEEAALHFEPEALAQLIALLVTINAWNRIAIPFRVPVGTYQPQTAVA